MKDPEVQVFEKEVNQPLTEAEKAEIDTHFKQEKAAAKIPIK